MPVKELRRQRVLAARDAECLCALDELGNDCHGSVLRAVGHELGWRREYALRPVEASHCATHQLFRLAADALDAPPTLDRPYQRGDYQRLLLCEQRAAAMLRLAPQHPFHVAIASVELTDGLLEVGVRQPAQTYAHHARPSADLPRLSTLDPILRLPMRAAVAFSAPWARQRSRGARTLAVIAAQSLTAGFVRCSPGGITSPVTATLEESARVEIRHVNALRRIYQADRMLADDGRDPRSFLLIHRGPTQREIDHPRWTRRGLSRTSKRSTTSRR